MCCLGLDWVVVDCVGLLWVGLGRAWAWVVVGWVG